MATPIFYSSLGDSNEQLGLRTIALDQWFSNFSVYRYHQEDLLTQIAWPYPQNF